MAIDYNSTTTFGQRKSNQAQAQQAGDKPAAQIWLNIGYTPEHTGDEGKYDFVSLPVGIPLDTAEHIRIKGGSDEFREFQHARNGLLDMLLDAAKQLQPGQSELVNLQIQIRRVADQAENAAPIENRFGASALKLFG